MTDYLEIWALEKIYWDMNEKIIIKYGSRKHFYTALILTYSKSSTPQIYWTRSQLIRSKCTLTIQLTEIDTFHHHPEYKMNTKYTLLKTEGPAVRTIHRVDSLLDNIQYHKYSVPQIFSTTNIYFHKYSVLQIFSTTNIQYHKYAVPQIFTTTNIHYRKYSFPQIFVVPQIFRFDPLLKWTPHLKWKSQTPGQMELIFDTHTQPLLLSPAIHCIARFLSSVSFHHLYLGMRTWVGECPL